MPLAFAVVVALGRSGFVTMLLREVFGVDLNRQGFHRYNFWALSRIYIGLQLPLLILALAPALHRLHREWSPAAAVRGAGRTLYLRTVAFPILIPALLGTLILLFGNAFAVQATTCSPDHCAISNLAYLLVDEQRVGDVPASPILGYMLALQMVFTMALSIATYAWLQRASERWKLALARCVLVAGSWLLRALRWWLH